MTQKIKAIFGIAVLASVLLGGLTLSQNAFAQVNNPPTVTIQNPADGSQFLHNEVINFNGIASDPEDGSLTFFIEWSSDLDGPIGIGWTFTKLLSDGDHTITALVTDSGGLTDIATVNITVGSGPINIIPAVTITSPTSESEFTEGSIFFSATATDEEDGDISSNLQWSSSIDGAIGSGGSFSTSALSVGIHQIEATVTDSGGALGINSIQITVNQGTSSSIPSILIIAPADGSSFDEDTTFAFVGNASDDQDGSLTSQINWSSSKDGVLRTGIGSFLIDTLSVGTHIITATVTNSGGISSSDQITVTITSNGSNSVPDVTINFPETNSEFSNGQTVSFAGFASDSEEGDISSQIQWSSSIDNAIGSGASFSKSNLSVGTHTITAAATDSVGATGNDSITLIITGSTSNTAPTVSIISPSSGSSFTEGTSVTFQGSATDNQDGSLSSQIQWSSSRDGSLGTGSFFSLTTLSVGTHTITAQVTDSG